jgi:hypothetical protein
MAAQVLTHTASGVARPGPTGRAHPTTALGSVDLGKIARKAAISGLLAAMATGSVALWTVVPAGVLWLVAVLGAPSPMGIYLAVAAGIPAAIALGAQALARVEHLYMRMTGATPPAPLVRGRRRSLTDSNAPRQASVLEKMMVASVLLAVVTLTSWFVAFAGFSLPT